MRGTAEATSEKLLRDVRMVVQEAEDLIKATTGDFGDRTREARAKLAGALVVAKETCNRLEQQVSTAAHATRRVIRNRPYQILGAAFGLGVVLGLLAARVREGSESQA